MLQIGMEDFYKLCEEEFIAYDKKSISTPIEASGKVSLPIFVDEISANTKGYELLFKAACMG